MESNRATRARKRLRASDPGKYAPRVQALRERIEGPKLRAEIDAMLSDFNRRVGGDG